MLFSIGVAGLSQGDELPSSGNAASQYQPKRMQHCSLDTPQGARLYCPNNGKVHLRILPRPKETTDLGQKRTCAYKHANHHAIKGGS